MTQINIWIINDPNPFIMIIIMIMIGSIFVKVVSYIDKLCMYELVCWVIDENKNDEKIV